MEQWTPDAVIRVILELGGVVASIIALWRNTSTAQKVETMDARLDRHGTQINNIALQTPPAVAVPVAPVRAEINQIPLPAQPASFSVTSVTNPYSGKK